MIRKLVGDQFFRAMAGVYLRIHLPTSPIMMLYGDMMPKFLRRFNPAQSLPYLSDITTFELAMRHLYHAANVSPIDATVPSALALDKMMGAKLTLAPATTVIEFQFTVSTVQTRCSAHQKSRFSLNSWSSHALRLTPFNT